MIGQIIVYYKVEKYRNGVRWEEHKTPWIKILKYKWILPVQTYVGQYGKLYILEPLQSIGPSLDI